MARIQEESERSSDSNEDIAPVKLCGGVANQDVDNYPPLKTNKHSKGNTLHSKGNTHFMLRCYKNYQPVAKRAPAVAENIRFRRAGSRNHSVHESQRALSRQPAIC